MKKKQLIFTTILTSLLLASCGPKEEITDKEQNNNIDNSFMESEDDSFDSFEDAFEDDEVGTPNEDNFENNENSESQDQHQNLGPEYDEIPPLPGEEPEGLPPVEENEQTPVEPDLDFTEPESKPEENPLPENPLPENPLPEEDVVTFNNSIEVYKASVEKLKNINYSYEGIGFSKPTVFDTLNLHEQYSQNNGNISFSKVSSGSPIAFNSTTYAERYNVNGDKVTRASANSYKAYEVTDGRINVTNWGADVDSTLADVERDFAKRPGEYIYYAVDLDTVTEDSLLFTVDENGNYHVNFTFVFDNNGDSSSKTVNGYGNHITTISHQKFKRCTSSEITLVLDEDLKPISYDLHENYEVIKLGLTCYIENSITYKFTY